MSRINKSPTGLMIFSCEFYRSFVNHNVKNKIITDESKFNSVFFDNHFIFWN